MNKKICDLCGREIVKKDANDIFENSIYGGLMPNIDFFNNVSVSELFKVINNKLNKREEEE